MNLLPEVHFNLVPSVTAILAGILVFFFSVSILYRTAIEAVANFEIEPLKLGDSLVKDIEDEPADGLIYTWCPADGKSLSLPIKPHSTRDIDEAIEKARDAQIVFAQASFSERRKVLRTLLQYVLNHQEEIVQACCLDTGKTKIDASFGEILVTLEKLQWTIRHGEKALRPSRRPTNLLMCYKRNTVIYEPLGVVAACVSWNYPFHNFISPVISSLFSGNAILVKPSEQTALSSLYFLRIIRGALEACGHSPELVQCVNTWPPGADYLTSHRGVSHITFIGSRGVAHHVCSSAAKALTPVTVELGGKDPAVILDDSATIQNLEQVSNILLRGVFQSSGQNCIGIERVIALPGAYQRIIDTILPKIKAMKVGYPLPVQPHIHSKPRIEHFSTPDLGAVISSKALPALEHLVKEAENMGATIHHGGKPHKHPDYPSGHYFLPTFLSGVTPDMPIAQKELFAPVFLLMRADSIDHAIELANSTPYALGASVFGHRKQDTDRCVGEIKAGMVSVNDFGAYYAVSLPFGGTKESGYGRFGGEEGLRSLCNLKAICEDTMWARWLGISTRIPGPLVYPIRDGEAGWEMCKGIMSLGYGMGVRAKIWGLVALVKVAATAGKPPSLRTKAEAS